MNIQNLKLRHKELNEKISDGYQHYLSDEIVTRLKKEKLKIKILIDNELNR
jgi:hypothetical protein